MQLELFDKNLNLPEWIVPVKRLVLSESAGDWCRLPYPGHPHGCPNYGEKAICPPAAPRLTEQVDIERAMYLVHSEFDLARHADRMHKKHPKWTERQCRCLLYWQSRSRSQLKTRTTDAMHMLSCDWVSYVPEAMGLNVYATAAISGLKLERIRGLRTCRHVALIGRGKEGK